MRGATTGPRGGGGENWKIINLGESSQYPKPLFTFILACSRYWIKVRHFFPPAWAINQSINQNIIYDLINVLVLKYVILFLSYYYWVSQRDCKFKWSSMQIEYEKNINVYKVENWLFQIVVSLSQSDLCISISKKKNILQIIEIIDQFKVSKVPLWIEDWDLCMGVT